MTTDLKEQALETFLRDLPELMKERRGEERLGFSKQKHLLYQDCMGRGYGTEEFLVFCIEPWETEWFMPNVYLGEPGDAPFH